MEQYVRNVWNFVAAPKVYTHEDGYFIFRFEAVEARDQVLSSGPYSFNNRPFILRNWSIEFSLDAEVMRIIPL